MKALIVKLSSLGDIVQAMAAASYLKGRGFHVTWVVDRQFAGLVAACPYVDKVIELPLHFWKRQAPGLAELYEHYKRLRCDKYDLLFDLQGNCKSALVAAFCRAKYKIGFGKKTIAEWPALFACHFHFDPPSGLNIRDDYLHIVQSYFSDRSFYRSPPIRLRVTEDLKTPFQTAHLKVIVAAGAQWTNKELRWETLLGLIQKLDRAFAIEWLFSSGSEREKSYADTLSQSVKVARRLHLAPLAHLQQVMLAADAVFAVDSLPLHLAGLGDVPSFAIFGPSLAAKFAPLSSTTFQGSCPYGESFSKRCSKLRTCQTGACIKDIDLGELYQKAHSFLASI